MRVLSEEQIEDKKITIRYLESTDLDGMLKFINELSQEKTFVSYQGEKITEQDEIAYIARQLKKMTDKQCVNLVVEADGVIVGSSHIELGEKTSKHIGRFGISISKDFRAKGLGRKLMELIVQEAADNLPDLEIVTLNVFGKNATAIQIYRKFGFLEYGRLPDGVKLENGYDEYVYMFKKVR